MTTELRLAAIVALLSSSALRGATGCKSAALCMHLDAALRQDGALDPNLRKTLERALEEWKLALHFDCAPRGAAGHIVGPVLH